MNKKMMVMPLLFLILMAVPMVDAREGNETVIDIPDDVIIIHNVTEPDSIQTQLYNIYDWMMMHDELMMNSRSSVRKLNATLNDTIVNFVGVVEDLGWKLLDSDAQLQGQIDTQNTYIEELRQEVAHVYQELKMERANRNNLTILFLGFSVLVILATFVINKR